MTDAHRSRYILESFLMVPSCSPAIPITVEAPSSNSTVNVILYMPDVQLTFSVA